MNKGCLKRCDKTASIISLKERSHVIHKARSNYNCLYANENFLNLDVLNDVRNLYTDVMVDLRNIPTHTEISVSKFELINRLVQSLAQAETGQLRPLFKSTNNNQYLKGLK